jgi:hypothetical protein
VTTTLAWCRRQRWCARAGTGPLIEGPARGDAEGDQQVALAGAGGAGQARGFAGGDLGLDPAAQELFGCPPLGLRGDQELGREVANRGQLQPPQPVGEVGGQRRRRGGHGRPPIARARDHGADLGFPACEPGQYPGIVGGQDDASAYGPSGRRITTSSAGHGGPSRRALRSSRAARCPFGNWSPGSQRHAATMARTRIRHSLSSSSSASA